MKSEIETKVIEALQECIKTKALFNISMRDLAETSGMSHQRILYHFKSKEQVILSYVEYVKDFFLKKCLDWFQYNKKGVEENNKCYLDRFFNYVSSESQSKDIPNATMQIYVMGKYDCNISIMIKKVYEEWKEAMKKCLVDVLGDEADLRLAESMMIIITGIFLCNYNEVLSTKGNYNQFDSISRFFDE